MRKALVVGVDYYNNVKPLNGCVRDAHEVKSVLERHADGSLNFGVKLVVATNQASSISRRQLKDLVQELFKDDAEIALFYFSGHGYIESSGGFLITSECADGDDGFSMEDLLLLANESKAQNKIIVLDCCHAGAAGSPAVAAGKAF